MNTKPIAAITFALVVLMGCGPDETTGQNYRQSDESVADNDSTMDTDRYEPKRYEPVTSAPPAVAADRLSPQSAPGTGASLERTEFAALDTNANGTLAKDEWTEGMGEFEDIDENSNGAIDREEFNDAMEDMRNDADDR
jgi:hypothetical protein